MSNDGHGGSLFGRDSLHGSQEAIAATGQRFSNSRIARLIPRELRGGDSLPSSRHVRNRQTFHRATAPGRSLLASASLRTFQQHEEHLEGCECNLTRTPFRRSSGGRVNFEDSKAIASSWPYFRHVRSQCTRRCYRRFSTLATRFARVPQGGPSCSKTFSIPTL
jgi:hypothetical protein